MATRKFLYAGQAVGDATTDGVVATKLGRRLDVGREIIDESLESFERFGGLREEIGVACEIDFVHFADVGDHDRFAVGLPHQPEHFGVAVLAVDHDLGVFHFVIDATDALLQIEHDGTGGVDEGDVVASCDLVSRGGFTVCTEQNPDIVQSGEGFVVNDHKTTLAQALAFAAVVDDVTETI